MLFLLFIFIAFWLTLVGVSRMKLFKICFVLVTIELWKPKMV